MATAINRPKGDDAFEPDPEDITRVGKVLRATHVDEVVQSLHTRGMDRRFYQARRWARALVGLGFRFGDLPTDPSKEDLIAHERAKVRSFRINVAKRIISVGKSHVYTDTTLRPSEELRDKPTPLQRLLAKRNLMRLITPTKITMQWIGERPLPEDKAARIQTHFPEALELRQQHKSGCTGLQQITLTAGKDINKIHQELQIEQWYRKHESRALRRAVLAGTIGYMCTGGLWRPGRLIIRLWPTTDKPDLT